MRKDSGFEVMDNIKIAIFGNDTVLDITKRNEKEICEQTLALALSEGVLEFSKEWNINGEKVIISVEKI